MPEVTVIIPVYNVEKYLPQCLDSVINQTLKEIEIICIDDGSTDSSSLILDAYAKQDKRIRVIHKENTGYGKSMNVGLRQAAGTYISVIESDDFAEMDMLEKLYCAAVKSGADITKANHFNYREGGETLCDWLEDFPKGRVINSLEFPTLLNKANTIWTCLFKRSFLNEHDIFFHETPGASYQDMSFALQGWLWAQKVYLIDDAVLHYRNDNPDSSMHNPYKVFCVFDEYEWMEERFKAFWHGREVLESYFVAAKYKDYFSHYYRVATQYQYALLLRLAESLELDIQNQRIQEAAFAPVVLNQLNEIHEDLNKFFQKTQKEFRDLRLDVCKLGNMSIYQNAFVKEISRYPQTIIYGAGIIGQQLARILSENGVKITCFAVTVNTLGNKECMGIPVRELRELCNLADSCSIIIAVAERSQYELYKNLVKFDFKNIFQVDTIVRRMFT